MLNWMKSFSAANYKTKIFQNMRNKTVVAGFAAAALTFAGGASSLADDDQLMTVYYVYMDDQYIGTVSDKKVIESMVDTKIKELEGSYTGLELSLGSEISFIPEQVFQSASEVNNLDGATEIKADIKVQAEAAALVIGGKPVAYVENQVQAKAVLTKIKSSYVSEEELKELEERKASANNSLPQLKENETRILDVQFSEEVSVSQTKADPDSIISAEEAAKLLQKGTLEEKKYQVKEGDVLSRIASAHNLDMEQLLALNSGLKEDSVLKVGQELNVTVLKPYVKVIVDKEVFKKETIVFEKEVVEDSSLPKGDTKVKQEGKNGVRAATYRITEENGQTVKKEVSNEEVLEEPVKNIVIKGTKVIPSRGEGSFAKPTVGGYISSPFGNRWGKLHKGIDIARPGNLTIKAADNGVVVSAGWDGAYGNKIVIDHQNGYRTVYAHLKSINVNAGQTVQKGSSIAIMGTTGESTGVHLHFEVYKSGKLQNPLKYVGY